MNNVLQPGYFVRRSSSRAADAVLLRLISIFYFSPAGAPHTGVAAEEMPFFYLGEEWRGGAGALMHQRRRRTGVFSVGRTCDLWGRALVWLTSDVDEVIFAPALER